MICGGQRSPGPQLKFPLGLNFAWFGVLLPQKTSHQAIGGSAMYVQPQVVLPPSPSHPHKNIQAHRIVSCRRTHPRRVLVLTCSSHTFLMVIMGVEGGIWLWKLPITPHGFQVIFKPLGHTTNLPGVLQAEVWGLVWGVRGDRGAVPWGTSNILHNGNPLPAGPSLPKVNPMGHIGHSCFIKGQGTGALLSPF